MSAPIIAILVVASLGPIGLLCTYLDVHGLSGLGKLLKWGRS